MRHLYRPFPWRLCTARWHVYVPRQRMPEDVRGLTPHVTGLFFCALFLCPTAPTTCPSLEAPAHGTKFGSKYFVGHEVHFTCSQGYHLVGSATRVCRDNGTWSGISAVCKGEPHWEFLVGWAKCTDSRPCVRPVQRLIQARNAVSLQLCYVFIIGLLQELFTPMTFSTYTQPL